MVIARRTGRLGRSLYLGLCLLLPIACREASAGPSLSVGDLARVLQGVRLVEPRFSGGFSYAPCVAVEEKGRLIPRAQCSSYPEEGTWRGRNLSDLGRLLSLESENELRPGVAHAHAVWSALFGATRALASRRDILLHRAATSLQGLRQARPKDPLLLNDLAAVRFLQAQVADDPAGLLQALDLIELAYGLAPAADEIRFNRALILSRWFLVFGARDAWKEVCQSEREPGWKAEAESRLALLERPSVPERWADAIQDLESAAAEGKGRRVQEFVGIDLQRAREFAIGDKLGAWGERFLSGDLRGAARELTIARALGVALAAGGGDLSVAESVRVVDVTTEPRARAILARGHRALGNGVVSYRRWQNGAHAEAILESAGSDLGRSGSPLSLWADELRARSISHQSRYEEALTLHKEVLERARERGLPALEGFIRWGIAWSLIRWKGSSFALAEEERSYHLLARAGEVENAAALRSLVGDAYFRLGQGSVAIRHWYEALRALAPYPRSLRRHNTFLRLPDQAFESGWVSAALAFRREQIRSAGDDKVQQAEALYHMGTMLAASGSDAEGLRETERALAIGGEVPQDGTGRKLAADILANLGSIRRRLNPQAALEPLTRAEEFFAADGGARPDEIANLTERALTFADLSRFAEARQDLERAFTLLEAGRRTIDSADFRASFEEASQRYYDAAIDIEWRQNRDPGRALALLERARGGLDGGRRFPDGATRALRRGDLGRVARLLDTAVPVIEYAVLPRSLLIWTFHGGACRFESRQIAEEALAAKVRDYGDRIAAGASQRDLRAAAESLASLLIPPELWTEPRATPILIIPDKSLHRLPFASLREPRTGTFFVEVAPLALAQSLSSLLTADPVRESRFSFDAQTLLVGNPVLDHSLVPALKVLPGAEREIRRIAPSFRQAKVLIGETATKHAFLASLSQVETLVFAGHSVGRQDRPGSSYLVLAPSKLEAEEGAAFLFADELIGHHFPRLRTVILSSCASVGPGDGRISGVSGLAGAFFASGASTVVGTLWEVDDEPQARLLSRMFLRLREGRTLVEALRSVQVAALRSGRGADAAPKSWSGLEILTRAPIP